MALCFKPLRLLAPCRPMIKRNLYILGNPDFDESKIKNISEVIEDLSSGVIGGNFILSNGLIDVTYVFTIELTGTSSYNPEEFKKRRLELAKYTPSNQDDLPVRRMLDSYDSAIIPLGD